MAFDIKTVVEGMLGAAGQVLADEWPKVQSSLQSVLLQEAATLEAIATARLAGEISEEEMQGQLEDEKKTLEACLLACEVQSKMATQKAINAAMDVLTGAVGAALKLA